VCLSDRVALIGDLKPFACLLADWSNSSAGVAIGGGCVRHC